MQKVQFCGATGLAIAADEQGPADGPLVLLLHGRGQNRFAWKGSGAALAALGYRVIALDAKGHGDSQWNPTAEYEMAPMAEDLLAVLDQLGGQPAAIVGASVGGMTALEAHEMTGHRDLFSAVVLVDITPKVELAGVRRIVESMTAHPDGFANLEDAAAAIGAYNPNRPPPSNASGLSKVLQLGEDGRWRWHWDPAFMTRRASLLDSDPLEWEAERAELADRLHNSAGALKAPRLLVRGLLSELVSDDAVAALLAAAPQRSSSTFGEPAIWSRVTITMRLPPP